MKKEFTDAVKSGDVVKVRDILLRKLKGAPMQADTLDCVRYAMTGMPDLFEKDNGKKLQGIDDLRSNFSRAKLQEYIDKVERDRLAKDPLDAREAVEVEKEMVADEIKETEKQIKADIKVEEKKVSDAGKKVADAAKKAVEKGKEALGKGGEVVEEVIETPAGEPVAVAACAITADDACRETEEDDSILALAESADRMMEEEGEPINEKYGRNGGRHVTGIIGYVLMALGAITSIVGICVTLRYLIGIGIGVVMIGAALVVLEISKK